MRLVMRFGLVLALAASTLGCKKNEPAAPPPGAAPTPGSYRFAFVTNNSSDFWNIAEKGVRKAEKDLGIKAQVFRPLKTAGLGAAAVHRRHPGPGLRRHGDLRPSTPTQ